jgi:hypothetical protein
MLTLWMGQDTVVCGGTMSATPFVMVVMVSVSLTASNVGQAGQAPSSQANDGKREFMISGCLLRSGYAAYQIDGATIEAIDGKLMVPDASPNAAVPKKWTLEGGGNLGPRVGEKVQVLGRSDWQDSSASKSADEPPAKSPSLDVKAIKTIASSCT